MADRNEKVFQRVRDELGKNPAMGSRDLYEMAQDADKGIAEDTLQQFHARYVLPIKREQSGSKGVRKARRGRKGRRGRTVAAEASEQNGPASGRKRGKARAGGSERDRVRGVLLEFARDFADAESRSEIVQVLSRVDDYVDRIALNGVPARTA